MFNLLTRMSSSMSPNGAPSPDSASGGERRLSVRRQLMQATLDARRGKDGTLTERTRTLESLDVTEDTIFFHQFALEELLGKLRAGTLTPDENEAAKTY